MIELGISRLNFQTEVRSGENSYTDLVLAGLFGATGPRRWRGGELGDGRGASGSGVVGAIA